MFRTVLIQRGERLSIRENWLVVTTEEGEKKIPLEDIDSVVIDNPILTFTVPAMTRLTENGAHVLLCDEKHLPTTLILPQYRHYRPLPVLRSQIEMTEEFKNALWDRITAQKIRNQSKVLSFSGVKAEIVERMNAFAEEVRNGDEGNREGIAAKMFFRALYGASFLRMADDGINAALNYGYTIIRSSFCKTLAGYGYQCTLGLHHIGEMNAFNLADDMMEPLRPLVDYWVDEHHEELTDELSPDQRKELAALTSRVVLWNGKKMKLRNAIDRYVSSLTTAILRDDAGLLLIPEILRSGAYGGEDGDD